MLSAMRLPHWIGLGLILAVLAGGIPSKWFGLASSKVTEVERLSSCMQRHRVALASIVTDLGDPESFLNATPAQRAHTLHAAERNHTLQHREAAAIEACAKTVAG
jgi:hypothetical protein